MNVKEQQSRFLTDKVLNFSSLIMFPVGAYLVLRVIVLGINQPLGYENKPIGMDFFCFWSAGRMVLEGNIQSIYDSNALTTFQQNYLGVKDISTPWFYPPLLLLYVSCFFALMPYKIAYFVYLFVSIAAYIFLVKRFFRPRSILMIMSFPALWFTLHTGQNGLLTAIILCGGLHLLAKHEVKAGAVLALMSFKPQFCFAIPIFLLLKCYKKAIFSGIVTFFGLITLSTLIWGIDIWGAFKDVIGVAQRYNQTDPSVRAQSLASLYGAVRYWGISYHISIIFHYIFALIVGCGAVRIWLLAHNQDIRHSVVIMMTLLLAPHVVYYDLVVTGAVIVWLWPYKNLQPALIILWFSPYIWNVLTGFPLIPFCAGVLIIQLNFMFNKSNLLNEARAA